MPEPVAEMLQGGHRNSLGRAEEVVDIVLADRTGLDESFASLADSDELVRMRAGDASRRSAVLGQRGSGDCRAPAGRGRGIEQPSVQWHVAQILQHLRSDLRDEQAQRAAELLQRNLTHSSGSSST